MGKTKDIREAVEAELAFDPLVDATGITVKNLNGDVALNGTAGSRCYPARSPTSTSGCARLRPEKQSPRHRPLNDP